MEIVLIGLNHRTAPVELRERVSFTTDTRRSRAAQRLRSRGVALRNAGAPDLQPQRALRRAAGIGCGPVQEAMELFLATFPRVELGFAGRGASTGGVTAKLCGTLFRVAAGIDSMLLGRGGNFGAGSRRISGLRVDHGATGPVLNRMFQRRPRSGRRRTLRKLMTIAVSGRFRWRLPE